MEEARRHAHPAEQTVREDEREEGVAGLGGVSYQIRALARRVFGALHATDKAIPWLTPYPTAYLYGMVVGSTQTFQAIDERLSGERRRVALWPTLAAASEFLG